MSDRESQHERWLEQYRSDELTLKSQAIGVLRELAIAGEIGTGERTLARLLPQIRSLIGQHDLLIQQLCKPELRVLREPAYLPSKEAV